MCGTVPPSLVVQHQQLKLHLRPTSQNAADEDSNACGASHLRRACRTTAPTLLS